MALNIEMKLMMSIDDALRQFSTTLYLLHQFNDVPFIMSHNSKSDEIRPDDVRPEDSASQVSAGSSTGSQKGKVARLKAQAEILRKRHELEIKEQKLKHEKEQLDIEAQIAEYEVEATEYDDNEVQLGRIRRDGNYTLNPLATEWPPAVSVPVTDENTVRHQQLLAALHLPHAEIWIERITSGQQIKPHENESLRNIADDLKSCEATLKAMNCLNEVNTQSVLVKIVGRLPHYLQMRWLKEVHEMRNKHSRSAEFHDLVVFVDRAAEEVTDPVYSRLLSSGRGTVRTHQLPVHKAVSANTSASSSQGGCLMCNGAHGVAYCEQFKGLDMDSRVKFARQKGLCFNCLKRGHKVEACTVTRRCTVSGCGRKHSQLLHKPSLAGAATQVKSPPELRVEAEERCMSTGAGAVKTALPLVPVEAWSSDGTYSVQTYALLDTGSTTSFCTERLMNDLRLEGQTEVLRLSTLDRSAHIEIPSVSLNITDMSGENVIHLEKIYVTHELPITTENGAVPEDVSRWPHLSDIELLNYSTVRQVDILIGQDVPAALAPLEVRFVGPNAPYAVKTAFGWTVQGPVGSTQQASATVGFVRGDALQQSLDKFWKLDSDVSLAEDAKGLSMEDKQAISVMERTIKQVDGHYEIAIPFKNPDDNLPDNTVVADLRLSSLSQKLSRNADLHKKYTDNMEDLFTKGYASKVPDEELERSDGKVWYLPHHAVISSKKPDKVRIVFDCAARFNGTSLNDCVLSGPDLTNQLMGVLFRFRQEPVAVMADIESMFHQVHVNPDDRDVLRFLWWPQGDMSREPEICRMNVHLFGGTWSPSCCNYALRRVGSDNKDDFSFEAVNAVTRNFYVDDCLKSVEDEAKGIELVRELTMLLKKGGFRLTKFTSNSRRVLESIPENDRSLNMRYVDLNYEKYLPTERALGISWNVCEDCFVFQICQKPVPLTKRGLLSKTCSVYDPAGFLSPYVLKAKMLIQELTRRKAGWDEPLQESEREEWSHWTEGQANVAKISIPRCLKYSTMKDVRHELHHFADASNAAYGSVSYIRTLSSDGAIHCTLLTAKSRLAPIKTITIPRLELMAAVLAVKVDHMVKQELDLPIQKTVFWTDSTIVLQYICSESHRFHTFVANRVAVICDATLPAQWRHVSTNDNPADDVSRGLSSDELIHSDRWWNGPSFLYCSEEEWPSQPDSLDEVSNDDPEVKRDKPSATSCVVSSDSAVNVIDKLLSYRSDWLKLKKDVAWLRRYLLYLKLKCDASSEFETGYLTASELNSAETVILRYVQKLCFAEEIVDLTAGRTLPRSSFMYRLCPMIMSDGLICVGGRLRNASISVKAKHPTILPRHHHVVDLIVRYEHERNAHVGREHLLSLLHEKYWIVRGRSAVRKTLSKCVTCKRLTARCGEQKMADLPSDRVTSDKPPFSYVGVDLFGYFLVRRGRSEVKRYGCLFTCLVIRAVHIEVVHSLDTDSFLNAVMRFISRRGKPVEFRSDNATNFKAGDRELREAVESWNHAQISGHLSQENIEWKYNPPGASHMGGVWERQIRSVRKVLNSLLKEQLLDDEALSTVMCQAEHIVNSRPLTAVSDDVNDLEALTPAHLLNLRQEPVMPPGIFVKQDSYVKRRWRQVQYIVDLFWRRWTREYLPLLQQRQKWCVATRNLQPGDIVLLAEYSPRNNWPLARVVDVHCGDDGHVRSATVRTRTTTVVRPIVKLCLLECANDVADSD